MLTNGFYDDILEREIYDLKNYEVGDAIIFNNRIETINYISVGNSTRKFLKKYDER